MHSPWHLPHSIPVRELPAVTHIRSSPVEQAYTPPGALQGQQRSWQHSTCGCYTVRQPRNSLSWGKPHIYMQFLFREQICRHINASSVSWWQAPFHLLSLHKRFSTLDLNTFPLIFISPKGSEQVPVFSRAVLKSILFAKEEFYMP